MSENNFDRTIGNADRAPWPRLLTCNEHRIGGKGDGTRDLASGLPQCKLVSSDDGELRDGDGEHRK